MHWQNIQIVIVRVSLKERIPFMVFVSLTNFFHLLFTLIITKYSIFLVRNDEVKITSNAPSMDDDSLTTLRPAGYNIDDMQLEMENTTGISSYVTYGDHLVDVSLKNYSGINYGVNDTHGYIDMLTSTEHTTSLPMTKFKTSTEGPEENKYDGMKVTASLIVKEGVVMPPNNKQHFKIQSNMKDNTEAPSGSDDEYKHAVSEYSDKDADEQLHTVPNQLPVQEERNNLGILPSKINAVQVDSENEKQGKCSRVINKDYCHSLNRTFFVVHIYIILFFSGLFQISYSYLVDNIIGKERNVFSKRFEGTWLLLSIPGVMITATIVVVMMASVVKHCRKKYNIVDRIE